MAYPGRAKRFLLEKVRLQALKDTTETTILYNLPFPGCKNSSNPAFREAVEVWVLGSGTSVLNPCSIMNQPGDVENLLTSLGLILLICKRGYNATFCEA